MATVQFHPHSVRVVGWSASKLSWTDRAVIGPRAAMIPRISSTIDECRNGTSAIDPHASLR